MFWARLSPHKELKIRYQSPCVVSVARQQPELDPFFSFPDFVSFPSQEIVLLVQQLLLHYVHWQFCKLVCFFPLLKRGMLIQKHLHLSESRFLLHHDSNIPASIATSTEILSAPLYLELANARAPPSPAYQPFPDPPCDSKSLQRKRPLSLGLAAVTGSLPVCLFS